MRLNAPYGAPRFLTGRIRALTSSSSTGLNAPYGAPCFPTVTLRAVRFAHSQTCLNTSHDAPRFLTWELIGQDDRQSRSLNAPYGAPRFLTPAPTTTDTRSTACLNTPYGARCFLDSHEGRSTKNYLRLCLNTPYGAPCFLTAIIYKGLARFNGGS